MTWTPSIETGVSGDLKFSASLSPFLEDHVAHTSPAILAIECSSPGTDPIDHTRRFRDLGCTEADIHSSEDLAAANKLVYIERTTSAVDRLRTLSDESARQPLFPTLYPPHSPVAVEWLEDQDSTSRKRHLVDDATTSVRDGTAAEFASQLATDNPSWIVWYDGSVITE